MPISENQIFYNKVNSDLFLLNFMTNNFQTITTKTAYNTNNQLYYTNGDIYELQNYYLLKHEILVKRQTNK